jgi:hypothetical protein
MSSLKIGGFSISYTLSAAIEADIAKASTAMASAPVLAAVRKRRLVRKTDKKIEEDKCECCKAPCTQEHERRCEYHPRRGLYDSEEERLKSEAAWAAFIKKCGENE